LVKFDFNHNAVCRSLVMSLENVKKIPKYFVSERYPYWHVLSD